jgi:ATP-dependent RNA helicase RhlE
VARAIRSSHQSLLFSATMPDDIANLAASMLKDPVRIEVTPVSSTVEKIEQSVLFVDNANKRALLTALLQEEGIERVLVFTRTKHGANKVAEHLGRSQIHAEAIHGNKAQTARQRALANFRSGRSRVLVATDIAARGIDIDGITHVVNFDLPNVPESYVHRIGRTARAGASGTALSFCAPDERSYLRDIERLTRRSLRVIPDHPFAKAGAANATAPKVTSPSAEGQREAGHRKGEHRKGEHRNGEHRNGAGRRRRRGAQRQDGHHQNGHQQNGHRHEHQGQRHGEDRPERPQNEHRRGEHRRGEHHAGEHHGRGHRHAQGHRDDRAGLDKLLGQSHGR